MSDAATGEGFYAERRPQLAADRGRLPRFIIIGAMKCGTTSMRHILAQSGHVFLPQGDVSFFDVDDIEQHADHFVPLREGWTFHDFEAGFDAYYAWYRSFFAEAEASQVIGENSTTYISSKLAPARIAGLLPDVKIVALLRDPVTRAYSHYWHNLFAGRVTTTFEETLRHNPGTYYSRGYYAEQLRRYYDVFDRTQVKVILFEAFIRDQQAVVDDLTRFIGLPERVDLSAIDTHRNRAPAPLSIAGRRMLNAAFGPFVAARALKQLPNMPGFTPDATPSGAQRHPLLASWVRGYRALRGDRKLPPMRDETRAFLEKLYRRWNAGLGELIEQDVAEYWPYMR